MRKLIFILIMILLAPGLSPAQQKTSDAERLAWWKEARFGMFIHWGVYSMYGGVYQGHKQARGDAAWILNRCKIPVAEYREAAKQFNPVNYDPGGLGKDGPGCRA